MLGWKLQKANKSKARADGKTSAFLYLLTSLASKASKARRKPLQRTRFAIYKAAQGLLICGKGND